jgi:phage-related protein
MDRGQAQFLRLYDQAGATRERWQSYWATEVSWSGGQWQYLPFEADGFVDGDAGAEQSLSVRLPATARAVRSAERALINAWLAELLIYRFDASLAQAGVSPTQTLIGRFNGQVVSASATVTTFTLELGTALAPVGATVPPRTLTEQLMGVGCRL